MLSISILFFVYMPTLKVGFLFDNSFLLFYSKNTKVGFGGQLKVVKGFLVQI